MATFQAPGINCRAGWTNQASRPRGRIEFLKGPGWAVDACLSVSVRQGDGRLRLRGERRRPRYAAGDLRHGIRTPRMVGTRQAPERLSWRGVTRWRVSVATLQSSTFVSRQTSGPVPAHFCRKTPAERRGAAPSPQRARRRRIGTAKSYDGLICARLRMPALGYACLPLCPCGRAASRLESFRLAAAGATER